MFHYLEYIKTRKKSLDDNPVENPDNIKVNSRLSSFKNNFDDDDELMFDLELDIIDDNTKNYKY